MKKIGFALRGALASGYRLTDLRADLMAGSVVGIVALPLSMALAIASGVAPQHGLYTAIVGGFVVALLGGSRVQVSGPTAAFVVILAPIATRFGLGGLLLATALAGLILIAMGAAGMGRFIEFVPYPVTTGFTAGIAVVIGTLQIKDLLGLSTGKLPEHYLDKLEVLGAALPTARWGPGPAPAGARQGGLAQSQGPAPDLPLFRAGDCGGAPLGGGGATADGDVLYLLRPARTRWPVWDPHTTPTCMASRVMAGVAPASFFPAGDS